MRLNVVKYDKIFYLLSGALIIASLLGLIFWGVRWGIDFRGGSLLEVEFQKERPAASSLQEALQGFNLGEINFQPTDQKNLILRFKDIDEPTHQKILEKINKVSEAKEIRFDSIGSVIGRELKKKTLYAILLIVVFDILYLAATFKKIASREFGGSFKFGVLVVLTLIHDIFITFGAAIFFGRFFQAEINTAFIAAILTVFGYSVNDTIVIFDRIRENILRFGRKDLASLVNNSVSQSLTRSLNTALTTILALLAVYIFGGQTTKFFALYLIIGIAVGTYSSIFIAAPLLLRWHAKAT